MPIVNPIYLFNDDHLVTKLEAKTEAEAPHSGVSLNDKRRIAKLMEYRKALLCRNDTTCKWYFMVFKPLDKPYKKDREWFVARSLEYVRRLLTKRGMDFIMTLETMECEKVHVNVMIHSPTDLTFMHDDVVNHKFKVYCTLVINKQEVFDYITKESYKREFIEYRDYSVKIQK